MLVVLNCAVILLVILKRSGFQELEAAPSMATKLHGIIQITPSIILLLPCDGQTQGHLSIMYHLVLQHKCMEFQEHLAFLKILLQSIIMLVPHQLSMHQFGIGEMDIQGS